MINIASARKILELMNVLAIHLNDEEISDIAVILHKAADRMIKQDMPDVKTPCLR